MGRTAHKIPADKSTSRSSEDKFLHFDNPFYMLFLNKWDPYAQADKYRFPLEKNRHHRAHTEGRKQLSDTDLQLFPLDIHKRTVLCTFLRSNKMGGRMLSDTGCQYILAYKHKHQGEHNWRRFCMVDCIKAGCTVRLPSLCCTHKMKSWACSCHGLWQSSCTPPSLLTSGTVYCCRCCNCYCG